MPNPSQKSEGIENFLQSMFGRSEAIQEARCIPAPAGCGGPAGPFRDNISAAEYRISGLCQTCQDSVFGMDD